MNELKGILITYKNEIAKVKFNRDHENFFKSIKQHTGGEAFDIGDVAPELNKAYGRLCFAVDDNGMHNMGLGAMNKAGTTIYAHKGYVVGNIIVFREDYNAVKELNFVDMSEDEQDRLYHDFRTTFKLKEIKVKWAIWYYYWVDLHSNK